MLSVRALDLQYELLDPASSIIAHLSAQGFDALRPFSTLEPGETPPLQPGWAIWVIAGVALFNWRQLDRGSRSLLAVILAVAFLLSPWTSVTGVIWHNLPGPLLNATNVWPEQRFYPIICVAGVMIGLRLTALLLDRRPGTARATVIGLVVLALWSAWEARLLPRNTGGTITNPTETALMMAPENVRLGRSSYALFGSIPENVTHGHMEPGFLVQLRQSPTLTTEPNSAWLAAQPVDVAWQSLDQAREFVAEPGRAYLLTFRLPASTTGLIVLRGPGLDRTYGFPYSGGPAAFGSAPGMAKTIPFIARSATAETIRVHATAAGVSMQIQSGDASLLPVRMLSHTPLRFGLNLTEGGLLKTPVMWIPGYVARVNGEDLPLRLDPSGALQVRVQGGVSEMEVNYVPPPGLAHAYYAALLAVVIWLATLCPIPRFCSPVAERRSWPGLLVAGCLALTTASGAGRMQVALARPALPQVRIGGGPVELKLDLLDADRSAAQPLLEFGQSGAADLIYLSFNENGQARIGIDHWGVGGPFSALLPEDDLAIRTLRIDTPHLRGESGPGIWTVVWENQVILNEELPAHPDPVGFARIGENTVGASTTRPRFTGRIVGLAQGSKH